MSLADRGRARDRGLQSGSGLALECEAVGVTAGKLVAVSVLVTVVSSGGCSRSGECTRGGVGVRIWVCEFGRYLATARSTVRREVKVSENQSYH